MRFALLTLSRRILLLGGCLLLLSGCGGSGTPPDAPKNETASTPETNASFVPLVPGSRVMLRLPPGTERYSRVYAFRRDAPLLLVVVGENTIPPSETADFLTGVVEASTGFGKPVESTRGNARELRLEGTVSGNAARMLVLVEGSAVATVMVVYAPEASSDAEAVLSSARVNATAPLDPLAIHALSVTPQGASQVLDTQHNPIGLGDPSVPTPVPVTEPVAYVNVVPHNEGPDISNEALGRLMGSGMATLQPDPKTIEVSSLTLDGGEAIQLSLSGTKNGQPISIYGYALRDGNTALLGVGYVAKSVAEAKLPAVIETLRSLKRHDFH